MIATSPVRNDISNLAPGAQIEMHQSATAYQNSLQWSAMNMSASQMSAYAIDPSTQMGMGVAYHHHQQQQHSHPHLHSQNSYDQMMGFSGSDEEEDCFDQISDHEAGDDNDSTNSSDELTETRIQQL